VDLYFHLKISSLPLNDAFSLENNHIIQKKHMKNQKYTSKIISYNLIFLNELKKLCKVFFENKAVYYYEK